MLLTKIFLNVYKLSSSKVMKVFVIGNSLGFFLYPYKRYTDLYLLRIHNWFEATAEPV